ncbi:MAG: glycine C-acetyltransferase [Gammaproteobacteria bacterium]
MAHALETHLVEALADLGAQGLHKSERILASPQGARVRLADGRELINLCANNYLGLANHPALIARAQTALADHGYGLASVRFICGTQDLHIELEQRLADFLGYPASILYSSCFDANGGLFETLLGEEDVVISDALNHASLIDGIRLSKAQRLRYPNRDLDALEGELKKSRSARFRMIVTDGVFSMDGVEADLRGIATLAERYDAIVMVDDSHAVGFRGPEGSGTPEQQGVRGRVHIVTGTLGKALGGGSGGYTASSGPVVDWLRQRSRPYLFSNSLPPAIVAASLAALELIRSDPSPRERLHANAVHFRAGLDALGFELVPGSHPIIPILLHDAHRAQKMAEALLEEGVYAIGFSFPVVPKGQARIRTQVSAAHNPADLDQALEAFERAGRRVGLL